MAKAFISRSHTESEVGDVIGIELNNAFEGELEILAHPQAGNWKQEIKKSINESDVGIFLLTPHYANSPWFVAEYAAFWLSDKPIYVLTLEFDKGNDNYRFIQPVDDIQFIDLSNVDQVKGFIEHISKVVVGCDKTPYKFAQTLSEKALNTYKEIGERTELIAGKYDRHHELLSHTWTMTPSKSDEGMFDCQCETEEKFYFLKDDGLRIYRRITQKSNSQFNFDAKRALDTVNIEYLKIDGKDIADPNRFLKIGKLIELGSDFEFEIKPFEVLKKGTVVELKYSFTMFSFKACTGDKLYELMGVSRGDDSVRYVIKILDPTDEFIYRLKFDKNSRISVKNPVLLKGNERERDLLTKGYSYSEEDECFVMQIVRDKVDFDTTYKLSWDFMDD